MAVHGTQARTVLPIPYLDDVINSARVEYVRLNRKGAYGRIVLVELPYEIPRPRVPKLDHPVQTARDQRKARHEQPPYGALMTPPRLYELLGGDVPLIDRASGIAGKEHTAFWREPIVEEEDLTIDLIFMAIKHFRLA